jgi:tetratricopeptide (TPR) repeat protein
MYWKPGAVRVEIMTKLLLILLLVVMPFSSNFKLNDRSVETEWILKLSGLIDQTKEEKQTIRMELIKYHRILLELGEVEKALSILNRPNLDFEKDEFLSLALKSEYIRKRADKKTLGLILAGIKRVKSPISRSDYFIRIGHLYLKTGEKKETEKILELALKRTMEIKYNCVRQADNLGQIFKMYKAMNMEEKARKVHRLMVSYYHFCEESKSGDLKKHLIFLYYSKTFIELGDYHYAKQYLEKAVHHMGKNSYSAYAVNMFSTSELYLKMQEKVKARRLVDHLINFCFDENADSSKELRTRMKELNSAFWKSEKVIEGFDKSYLIDLIRVFERRKQIIKDQVAVNEINKILILLHLKQKMYDKAFQIIDAIRNFDTVEEVSKYIFITAGDKIRNGDEQNPPSLVSKLDELPRSEHTVHYKIELYYEIAQYYSRHKKYLSAKEMINKAFGLLRQYKPETLVYIHSTDMLDLADLYKEMGDSNGLLRIVNYYKEKSEKENSARVLVILVDVYLQKDNLRSAAAVLPKIEDTTYRLLMEKSTDIDYEIILDEFFRMFIKRKNRPVSKEG